MSCYQGNLTCNNIIINNDDDDERFQDPSCCSEFPWAQEIISPKIWGRILIKVLLPCRIETDVAVDWLALLFLTWEVPSSQVSARRLVIF
jgi:hypothetical protein